MVAKFSWKLLRKRDGSTEIFGYTRESSRPTTNLYSMFLSGLEGNEQLTTCAY